VAIVYPAELDTCNCGPWTDLAMCIWPGSAAWLHTPDVGDHGTQYLHVEVIMANMVRVKNELLCFVGVAVEEDVLRDERVAKVLTAKKCVPLLYGIISEIQHTFTIWSK